MSEVYYPIKRTNDGFLFRGLRINGKHVDREISDRLMAEDMFRSEEGTSSPGLNWYEWNFLRTEEGCAGWRLPAAEEWFQIFRMVYLLRENPFYEQIVGEFLGDSEKGLRHDLRKKGLLTSDSIHFQGSGHAVLSSCKGVEIILISEESNFAKNPPPDLGPDQLIARAIRVRKRDYDSYKHSKSHLTLAHSQSPAALGLNSAVPANLYWFQHVLGDGWQDSPSVLQYICSRDGPLLRQVELHIPFRLKGETYAVCFEEKDYMKIGTILDCNRAARCIRRPEELAKLENIEDLSLDF